MRGDYAVVATAAGIGTASFQLSNDAGAPATIGLGQVVEFQATGPFTITSQDSMHPFYFAAHMTGCSVVEGGSATDAVTPAPGSVPAAPKPDAKKDASASTADPASRARVDAQLARLRKRFGE